MSSKDLRRRLTATFAATALMATGLALAASPQHASAAGYPRSDRIAMVPDAGGRQDNGGSLPTTGFPSSYSPTFTNVSAESIRDDVVNPLGSGYDTVVLNSVCDIDTFLSNAQFKSRVEGFVSAGGKLVIWDSECTSTDYSKFSIPFQTSNPGAAGAQGTLVDVEENTLSSKDPSSPNFVDVASIASGTDAVGDANVFTTYDPRWFVDLKATNILGVAGPVQAYANLGSGLVIYSGLDKDYLPGGSFDPAATDGASQLNRIWLLELLQPWNPDGLPNSTPATGHTGVIVSFGDSIAAGEGSGPSTGYPKINPKAYSAQLAKQLGWRSYNFAISGACAATAGKGGAYGTPKECEKSIVSDEIPLARKMNLSPDLVTITVGANDIRFGDCVTGVLGLPGATPCTGKIFPAHLNALAHNLQQAMAQIRDMYGSAVPIAVTRYFNPLPGAVANVSQVCPVMPYLYLADEYINHGAWAAVGSVGNLQTKAREYQQEAANRSVQIISNLNSTLQNAATPFGAKMVSLDFTGHDFCTDYRGRSDSWVLAPQIHGFLSVYGFGGFVRAEDFTPSHRCVTTPSCDTTKSFPPTMTGKKAGQTWTLSFWLLSNDFPHLTEPGHEAVANAIRKTMRL